MSKENIFTTDSGRDCRRVNDFREILIIRKGKPVLYLIECHILQNVANLDCITIPRIMTVTESRNLQRNLGPKQIEYSPSSQIYPRNISLYTTISLYAGRIQTI